MLNNMISLEEYVKIYEAKNEIRYLIQDFGDIENKDDKTTAIGFFNNLSKEELSIIKFIYDWRNQNKKLKEIKSKPAPIIANYNGIKGAFACRRWVQDNLPNIISKLKSIKTFKGFHNTNIKDTNSQYVPSAQDMELVICNAYNQVNGLADFKKFEGENLEKSELIANYYIDNKEVFDKIVSIIPKGNKSLNKLANQPTSKKWSELGSFGNNKPNTTPKTDIYTEDGKLKISCKEINGSQLMSGSYNEAKATIMSAIEKSKISGDDIDELKKLLENPWYKIKSEKGIAKLKREGNKEVLDAEVTLNKTAKLFNKIIKSNKDFENAILREAMTGEVKFDNGLGTATSVLVWDEKNPDNSKFYNIDEYIKHIKTSNLQYLFNFKSANNSSWQNMRILTI